MQEVGGLDPRFHFLLDHQLWIRLAAIGPLLHVDQTWAAARYHAGRQNWRLAVEFGRETFEVLSWAEGEPGLASRLRKIKGPALASAYRLNARYLLDVGRPREALGAWMRTLAMHPPARHLHGRTFWVSPS